MINSTEKNLFILMKDISLIYSNKELAECGLLQKKISCFRMSHLDFLVSMDWKEESSRVVRRLVQTQSHIPEAWVFAARFEVERKVTL